MSDIIVYHGETGVVQNPNCRLGRPYLDFGQGFYVTELRQQAKEWAQLMATRRKMPPVLNRYILNRDAALELYRHIIFNAYGKDWLDFIVANRQGHDVAAAYDYVEGGVANDRVIDTVNLYMAGLMDAETALERLARHQPNKQICLLNQQLVDQFLRYDGTEEL